MSNQYTYAISSTAMSVGTSGVLTVDLRNIRGCRGAFLKIVAPGTSGMIGMLADAAGATAQSGFPVFPADPPLYIDGPALFYLRAANNSVTVGLAIKLTAGASQLMG